MAEKVMDASELLWDPANADLGFEGVAPGCIKQGFLKVAQFGSDEVKKGGPKYMAGLEPGMYYCPQRRKIYGESFLAVAVKFWQSYAVYDGEGTASKFKGNMTVAEFEEKVRPNAQRVRSYMVDSRGYRYVDTRNFLVIPYDSPLDVPLLFSLSSTGIAASRDWLTLMESLTVKVNKDGKQIEVPVPMRGGVWKLTSAYTKNDQGDFYQVNTPEFIGLIDPSLEVGGITLRERVNTLHIEAKKLDVLMLADTTEQAEPKEAAKEAPAAIANVKNVMAGKDAAKDALDVF